MSRNAEMLVSLALSMSLFACSSESEGTPPPGGGPDGGNPPGGDGGAPPGDSDAAVPSDLDYPAGPYGIVVGSIVANHTWKGYVDSTADTDEDPFNEPVRDISLADFYVKHDPASRLLVIDQSAGWCVPCQDEAVKMPAAAHMWQPKGIRFLTLMWETVDGNPGTTDYAKVWGNQFHLITPTAADPEDLCKFGFDGIPSFVVVDTQTMKIVHAGYDGLDELVPIFQMYAP